VTELAGRWRVVELWTVPAAPALAAPDLGMIPWVPLMHTAEPPEVVVRRCREIIDQHAPTEQRESLITVTQVFTRLRYKDANLLTILGRRIAMEDALDVLRPLLLREYAARRSHKAILKVLTVRFGAVPPALEAEVRAILDEGVLDAVVGLAASCSDLEQFQAEMRAIPRPPEPWDPADEPDPKPSGMG
jgi:hypothetical protein